MTLNDLFTITSHASTVTLHWKPAWDAAGLIAASQYPSPPNPVLIFEHMADDGMMVMFNGCRLRREQIDASSRETPSRNPEQTV